jgi:methylenetetrahydrofolate dehydrogenase (NADP+)/methenyltetrahydrofolate cyclohydrolase
LAHLLDGKRLAEAIKADVKKEVAALEKKFHRKPTFACIAIGQNPSTCVYCKAQARVADELGIAYRIISLDAEARENDLIAQIARLNSDVVTGFIAPGKDVEGMHPEHLGRLLMGAGDRVVPCTAQACMELLKETGVDFYGKEAVIVGHSEIVGKPLALMLLHRFATVTVCHIATSEAHRLQDHVERADILISAVGKSHVIRGSWVKEGAIVIDVGINRHQERLVGDVEFDAAEKRASYITPVPGGVGPVTVAILMQNVLELIKNEFSR